MRGGQPVHPSTETGGKAVESTIDRPQIKPLTSLRFVAAVLVVMYHFLSVPLPGSHGPLRDAAWILRYIVAGGFAGVSFFFVLSGFILTYNYLGVDGRLRVSHKQFWIARLARIYPAYLLALALARLPYVYWPWCTGINVYPVCVRASPGLAGLTELTLTQSWLPLPNYPLDCCVLSLTFVNLVGGRYRSLKNHAFSPHSTPTVVTPG